MHIAFLTPEFPHKKVSHSAGIGTSIYNIAQGLIYSGVTVSIFVYGQKLSEVIEYNGIKLYLIKNKKYLFLSWFLHKKYLQNKVNKIIKKESIDLIEAADWTGMTSFMKFRIPLVIRIHGSDAFFCKLDKRKQKWKNYLFEKTAVKKADALVAVSNFVAKESKIIFDINKIISIIPNGINPKYFINPFPNSYNKNTILYFGTLIRKKGVLELAHIFNLVNEKIPESKLLLIGKDDFDKNTGNNSTFGLMKEIFTEQALKQVEYLGKIPYENLVKHINDAHICVFPSLAESFGMVTIEAMAAQKTVISSNYEWVQEIINHNFDGVVENPKNHLKFSEKICALLVDQNQCEKLAINAKEKIEKKFNIFKVAKENINFYKSIISKK